MGDMKTPDFDDLLAAFDIPDIDAKDAIQSTHEDSDRHAKQTPTCLNEVVPSEHTLSVADIPTVSVIVKNTVRPEQLDVTPDDDKDGQQEAISASLLQNGFGALGLPQVPSHGNATPPDTSTGETWAPKVEGGKPMDLFSHFSPVPDPDIGSPSDLIDHLQDREQEVKSSFAPPLPVFSSSPPSLDHTGSAVQPSETLPAGSPQQIDCSQDEEKNVNSVGDSFVKKLENNSEETDQESGQKRVVTPDLESPLDCAKSVTVSYSAHGPAVAPWPKTDKNVDQDVDEVTIKDSPSSPEEEVAKRSLKPVESSTEPASPRKPQSPVEKPEKVVEATPGSPQVISSGEEQDEISSDGSPSSSSSRPLKVRIKTIKTSSGGITRTVTRIPSDSQPKQSPDHSSPETAEASEVSTKEKNPDSSPPPLLEKAEVPPSMKINEVSKAGGLQLDNTMKVKGLILPVTTLQNASSAMLMAASVAKQKATASPPQTGKTVAKSTLNLVSQALPKVVSGVNTNLLKQGTATVTAHQKVNGTVGMVQQQKPSPTVAGSVISRSQSTLVEAFNKILNGKNLLPTYRPNLSPPADSCLTLPPSGYRCLECGDSFALEKSLVRHYDRRSMRIEVTCNHCSKRLVFFNKCSLLLHAREHKDKGLVMQCSHLVMRPVALDQMIGQPDVTPVASLASINAGKISGAPKAGGATAGSPGSTSVSQDSPVLPLNCTSKQLDFNNFKCPECKEPCKDMAGLAAHFQHLTSESTMCTLCPVMMPNHCSLNAHHRMHKHRLPHVCPECGGIARSANFQAHLKEACLHFSRRVGFRCPSCSMVFGGTNSIKSHIQTLHCEVFHKCPICPMAFKSAPSAHAHIYTQHPGFSNQQSKMIFKCVMCDTVFTHKPLLFSHFDQHLVKQQVSVFKCPDCPLLFAQKRTMLEHLKNTHSKSKAIEGSQKLPSLLTPKVEPAKTSTIAPKESPDEESSSSEDEDPPSSPESPKKTSGVQRKGEMKVKWWTCGVCHSRFPERDNYVAHMKKEHGKSVKKFPCRLCDRSFCSAPSLRRHVRINHEGIKRVFPCRYCTEGKRTFSSRLILEKHIKVRHSMQAADQTGSQEDLSDWHEATVLQGNSARKRKLSTEDGDLCNDEPDSTTPPSKVERRSRFRCMKCGYVTESSEDFQDHIPQHRTDESSHQCCKCGLCFTSQLSLNRHCFIIHKLKDPNFKESPDLESGEEQGAEEGKVKCKVCGKAFDSQLNLKTHFRTHGMAFIRQWQTVGSDSKETIKSSV
ncbi:zinc finger protein 687b [Latimeria chalumnae]|uniref:zinc finger protein 687b n=1 Tax=Latimeria chalumnae TaxID=7897 RepID=UPI0003C12CBB|nr:PREDICTED: zinc finger protein 687 isoform X2 [Latimeria chalumnae]XP_006003368.1 PREDICTED: zinc finger protein 687 isoform X2 [Latimeria chalumnae]XP_014348376.1 PREDICTED: zinc finger protein 687 isoform X2 [Latimeria chalumnae]|eukprot:XP_006003367.1 PREDICTED: zinc finger protein 687 isoform X2 [Latimeria chalumnae]